MFPEIFQRFLYPIGRKVQSMDQGVAWSTKNAASAFTARSTVRTATVIVIDR